MRKSIFVGAASCVVLALALIGGACSDDSDSSDDINTIAAINILDKAGLHDIDTSIGTNGKVPANASSLAAQLQTTVLLANWPGTLKDQATKLAAVFGTLASATADGDKSDLKKATEAAHNAHEAQHDFSHAVWDYLQKKAKVGATAGHDD